MRSPRAETRHNAIDAQVYHGQGAVTFSRSPALCRAALSLRRRDEVIKRAFNPPPKRNSEILGKKGRSKLPEKYRGIGYSVAREGDGHWVWKLHPEKQRDWPVTTGKERGSQDSAIEAAHRAIDRLLKSGV
jgi:hypothetical protein